MPTQNPTAILVPMEIQSIDRHNDGTVSIHGYVGDYGVTFHARGGDYEALVTASKKLLPR